MRTELNPPGYPHYQDPAPQPRIPGLDAALARKRAEPLPPDPLPDVADPCPHHRKCRTRLGLPAARYCGHTGLYLADGTPSWQGCFQLKLMEEANDGMD